MDLSKEVIKNKNELGIINVIGNIKTFFKELTSEGINVQSLRVEEKETTQELTVNCIKVILNRKISYGSNLLNEKYLLKIILTILLDEYIKDNLILDSETVEFFKTRLSKFNASL